jgi:hypothetical protein
MIRPAGDLQGLLQETIAAHVSASACLVGVTSTPIASGMSGASVRRHQVAVECQSEGEYQVSLVTKEAGLLERRVLVWLTAQKQRNVPFSHTLDLAADGPALVCQQDVGDTYRPTSLEPITSEALQKEAEGLAAIHAANRGRLQELAWLPRILRGYFTDTVIKGWWRPHWEKALGNSAFRSTFQRQIPLIEAAADVMVEELSALADENETLTLVHTDINPSNVLVHQGKPFYIDWQVAHYGPFYLDLPHHFCTLQQAEHYRQALDRHGIPISSTAFEERYRAAARGIGFRYIWWTLADWQDNDHQTRWVLHYMNLILGRV